MRNTTAALIIAACAAQTALAQLTPDRTYYGVDRAVPMQVAIPSGAAGEAKIDLYAAGSAEPAMSASVVAGGANLSALFPKLWEKTSSGVMYAQLVVGDKKVGAPVVLQLLLDVMPAGLDRATGKFLGTLTIISTEPAIAIGRLAGPDVAAITSGAEVRTQL